MFDIAGTELLLIVVIAIIVVGPKDLPRMMRAVGQWVRKIQAAAAEFRRQIDELAKEAELDEIIAEANAAGRKIDPGKMIQDSLDPDREFDKPILTDTPGKESPPDEKDEEGGSGDDEAEKEQ